MNKRLFPRMAYCLTLITSFLFMPFSAVYADGLTQDGEYWKWWYIENTTDAITDGEGASADNLTDTYNGSTVGQYVYDQTGLTADDVKEYVQQQYDNATGYVEHTAEWYSSAIDDIWQSSIDVGTKAKYQAEKALRETVDTAGNAVVNVSSSGYWNNVYNDIFNSGGYNDQYQTSDNNSYNGTTTNGTFNISCIGLGSVDTNSGILNGTTNAYNSGSASMNNTRGAFIFSVNVNGSSGYFSLGHGWAINNGFTIENVAYSYNGNEIIITLTFKTSTTYTDTNILRLTDTITSGNSGGTPVLQPKQVGYVIHNGIKYPVYTDPSLNPFKVNDNGTVTFYDDNEDEPIYVDPSQFPDTLDILEYVDNDDQTQNPYNPQGKPWNTQPDGTVLGGLFSNLIKDISSIFNGIVNAVSNLIDKIIKAIKDIANLIVDALKSFWNLLIGDIEEYPDLFETEVDNNFGMISDLYDLLLECMGVDA